MLHAYYLFTMTYLPCDIETNMKNKCEERGDPLGKLVKCSHSLFFDFSCMVEIEVDNVYN